MDELRGYIRKFHGVAKSDNNSGDKNLRRVVDLIRQSDARVVNCAARRAPLIDSQSITKSAVGLAFLLAKVDLNLPLIPEDNDLPINLEMALNHMTGVENNEDFDWKTFMTKSNGTGLYEYVVDVFLSAAHPHAKDDVLKSIRKKTNKKPLKARHVPTTVIFVL